MSKRNAKERGAAAQKKAQIQKMQKQKKAENARSKHWKERNERSVSCDFISEESERWDY